MGAHSDMWNPRTLTLVEHGGEARLGEEARAAPAGLRPTRPGPAGAGEEARARPGDRDPVRHPRFQRLAAAASEGAKAALRGRLDRHLGDPLRASAATSTNSIRSATRSPMSARSAIRCLRALHGRARVRAPDRRRCQQSRPRRSSTRVLAETHHGAADLRAGLRAVSARKGPLDARPGDALSRRAQRRREPLPRADDGGVADARRRVRTDHRRGPVRAEPVFCSALSAITGRPVEPSDSGTGTMLGTLMTATGGLPRRPATKAVQSLSHPGLWHYAAEWQRSAADR